MPAGAAGVLQASSWVKPRKEGWLGVLVPWDGRRFCSQSVTLLAGACVAGVRRGRFLGRDVDRPPGRLPRATEATSPLRARMRLDPRRLRSHGGGRTLCCGLCPNNLRGRWSATGAMLVLAGLADGVEPGVFGTHCSRCPRPGTSRGRQSPKEGLPHRPGGQGCAPATEGRQGNRGGARETASPPLRSCSGTRCSMQPGLRLTHSGSCRPSLSVTSFP